jgi:hypothetical protein
MGLGRVGCVSRGAVHCLLGQACSGRVLMTAVGCWDGSLLSGDQCFVVVAICVDVVYSTCVYNSSHCMCCVPLSAQYCVPTRLSTAVVCEPVLEVLLFADERRMPV